MIAVDMGIETALNVGLPSAAIGSSAGLGATVNSGPMLRAGRTSSEGPACFRTALRAAAANDQPGPAASRPAPGPFASAGPSKDEPTREAEALESDARNEEGQSTEPAGEAQAVDGLECSGMPWSGPLQAAGDGDISGASSAEAIGDRANVQNFDELISQGCSELADLLSRLQRSLAGDAGDASVLIRQLAERVDPYRVVSDSGAAPRAGGILTDLLRQLRDALPAAALEPAIAGGGDAAAQTLEKTSGAEELASTGKEAAGARRTVEVADVLLPAVRSVLAQLRVAAGAAQGNGASSAASGEAPAAPSGTAAGLSVSAGAADAATGYAGALRAAQHPEDARNGAAPEPSRFAGTEFEHSGSVGETRHEAPAGSNDFRQSAGDSLFSKMPASENPAAGGGEALPEEVAALTREARSVSVAEGGLEKAPDAPSAFRDKEALAGSGRAGIYDQIVQRAAVQLKSDQKEINIDLKPDFLGRVRMQILTENQQVTVRILTELATVRDMIETGLNQLKSELQSQGLQVERLEVAVADDHRQRGWRQANSPPERKTAAGSEVSTMGGSETEERSASPYYRQRSSKTAGIDMFV